MRNFFRLRAIQGTERVVFRLFLAALFCFGMQVSVTAASIDLKTDDYDPSCGIEISQRDRQIVVSWKMATNSRGRLIFDLTDDQPLVQSAAVSTDPGKPFRLLVESLDPVVMLRVGKRDLARRGGWTIFFDRMQRKPHKLFVGALQRKQAIVSSTARRAA